MGDAIGSLRDRKIGLRATWGSLNVAGDRGAPAIPLGGGTGDAAGNANARTILTYGQSENPTSPLVE